MRWFLDMCIILGYINEGDNPKIITKTISFVNQKKDKDKFVLCYYIKDDNIPRWLNRKRIIFREILRQIKDSSYIPYSDKECSFLWDKDKNQVLKLIAFANTQDKIKMINEFENVYQEIERRIKDFLDKYIDEFVIPIKDIDSELRSHLMAFLNIGNPKKNDSDAKTIASAIQEHNKKELIIITADKHDWNNELLEEINYHMNLKEKYPKLPQIKYIQNC